MGLLSTALAESLEHGSAVIVQSRLLLKRCRATGMKSRRLARDFVLARPHSTRRLIRGASDLVEGRAERPREIWRHRPTGHYWIVVTDITGAPESAAGPFPVKEWDPSLLEYVILDRNHSLDWVREYINEFVRDDVSSERDGLGPHS